MWQASGLQTTLEGGADGDCAGRAATDVTLLELAAPGAKGDPKSPMALPVKAWPDMPWLAKSFKHESICSPVEIVSEHVISLRDSRPRNPIVRDKPMAPNCKS